MSNHNGTMTPEHKGHASTKDADPAAAAGEETKFAMVQDFIKSLMDAHRYVHNRRTAASKH